MKTWVHTCVWILILVPMAAQAIDNRCSRNIAIGDTQGLCQGVQLPYEQTRGRHNSRLVCSGNVDHYVRRPQEITDYGEWSAAVATEGSRSQHAFEMRQKQPDIAWSGRIPYTVTEQWDWVECAPGVDRYICGTHTEWHTETYYTTECDRQKRCKSVSHTRRVSEEVANECYYDHPRSASIHCSEEAVSYQARFERDPKWNPSASGYNEFIPNKYDLLPGEVEDIQVYNNRDSSTRLQPDVVIGDKWNDYSIHLSGPAVGAACRQNAHDSLNVSIVTNHRLLREGPNAFRLPVDFAGKSVPPLDWIKDTGTGLKKFPRTLRLNDTSSSMVNLIARQSRQNEEREELKERVGAGGNRDGQKKLLVSDPFFKDTKLRVQLYEAEWSGDSVFSPPFYVSDSQSVVSANLSISKLQAIRNSDMWEIPLNDEQMGANVYKRDKWLAKLLHFTEKPLKPNQRYILRFSMFQKGVPFYLQDCKDATGACESDQEGVFSKPIMVTFRTNENFDERSFLQKLNEFTLVDYLDRKWKASKPEDDDANKSDSP